MKNSVFVLGAIVGFSSVASAFTGDYVFAPCSQMPNEAGIGATYYSNAYAQDVMFVQGAFSTGNFTISSVSQADNPVSCNSKVIVRAGALNASDMAAHLNWERSKLSISGSYPALTVDGNCNYYAGIEMTYNQWGSYLWATPNACNGVPYPRAAHAGDACARDGNKGYVYSWPAGYGSDLAHWSFAPSIGQFFERMGRSAYGHKSYLRISDGGRVGSAVKIGYQGVSGDASAGNTAAIVVNMNNCPSNAAACQAGNRNFSYNLEPVCIAVWDSDNLGWRAHFGVDTRNCPSADNRQIQVARGGHCVTADAIGAQLKVCNGEVGGEYPYPVRK